MRAMSPTTQTPGDTNPQGGVSWFRWPVRSPASFGQNEMVAQPAANEPEVPPACLMRSPGV